MSNVEQCSHRTIAEWNALHAERDRLEAIWKATELDMEKLDDAYVAAIEQLQGAVDELARLRGLVDAMLDGSGEGHYAAIRALRADRNARGQ